MTKDLEDEILQSIRLIRTQRIGNITFFKLIEEFKSAVNAVNNIPSLLKNVRHKRVEDFKIYPKEKALKEIEYCNKNNIKIVPYFSNYYPYLLTKIENKPPLLFVKGNTTLLRKKSIALIGSRNNSTNASKVAQDFAYNLGKRGFNIVSGMAKGIDNIVHKSAIKTGTTAILGCGVDVVYPKENKKIYDEIAEKGVLVSEFACKTKPQASFFPIRNRIISGMSRGVLVIESSVKSGAFSTANLALKQQRILMAVPCSPFNKQSNGNNLLIQKGANLVQDYQDVLKLVNNLEIQEEGKIIEIKSLTKTAYKGKDVTENDREKITSMLSYDPIEVDLIVREGNFSYSTVATVLLELELSGFLTRYSGNKVGLLLQEKSKEYKK